MRKHSIELLALTLAAGQLVAQQPLDSASVVRLHLARGGPVQVVLLAPFAPELTAVTYRSPLLRDCGVPRALCQLRTPAADARAIEVAEGNHVARGAVIGAGIGGALGFALGLTVARSKMCVAYPLAYPGAGACSGPSDAGAVATTTLVGAVMGAGLGVLVGLGSPASGPAP